MRVSERLRGLHYYMKDGLPTFWTSVSPLTRRLIAFGVISEMRIAIEQLEAINQRLDFEISTEDADIDFDLWLGNSSDIQYIFQNQGYITSGEDDSTVNKLPDLFPIGKSTTFKEASAETLKTGLRQLNSDINLNHTDIATALTNGFGRIVCLVREIQEKMNEIPNELYEDFCHDSFDRDLDLAFQAAERDYLSWKDEHEWKSQQSLEDKRTQEILRLITSGVFKHAIRPTNREIKESPIKIQEEALEYNTTLPDDIEVECARVGNFVFMKKSIMWLDYVKIGKYLYKHFKDITFEEELAIKYFNEMLGFIHHDMAVLNPSLAVYLPDYEDNKLQAVFDNALKVITSCNSYLSEKLPNDFLKQYLEAAFYGEIKHEVQTSLGRKGIYTKICKLLGMLKASIKVFKVDTSSEQLAACVSKLTDKPNKDSMIRKIDEGASDKNSKIRIWTDDYIKTHCYTEKERLFLKQAKS